MNLNVFGKHFIYSVDVFYVFDTGGAGGYVYERISEEGGGEEIGSIDYHQSQKQTWESGWERQIQHG